MKKLSFVGMFAFGLIISPALEASAGDRVSSCSSTQKSDIEAVLSWISSNWTAFEKELERASGANVKSCLKNRFASNGKAVCESKSSGMCSGANGWASYLSQKCHLCPTFLSRVGKMSAALDRRACYAALLTHEFGHTCWRGHGSVEKFDNAAFDFWKANHAGVSSTLTLSSCGMD